MRIRSIRTNQHRRALEVELEDDRLLAYPYARLVPVPDRSLRVREAYVDPDLGLEAVTYILDDGTEGSLHVDEVLHFHGDPDYLRDLLLYRLTVEAEAWLKRSGLSKREVVRLLGTSMSQLYRLLDPTNYRKSVDQMVRLLYVVGCDIDLAINARASHSQYLSHTNDPVP